MRVDELLGRRRARGDADRLDAVEPGLVDLGLVVDQVRLDAVRARDLDEPVRVGRVARADHQQQVDLVEHLLHGPLAVGGRVADVLLLRPADVREAAAQRGDDVGRLVHRQRRLRRVGEPVARGAGSSSASAASTLSTRIVDSGASPIVPTTSSWPACPIRMIVYPSRAYRFACACTFVTSGQVASMTVWRSCRRVLVHRRSDAVGRVDDGGALRAPRSPRPRRSRRASRGRGRHGCCGRSACGRRRERRTARAPSRPCRPPARPLRNSRAVTRGGRVEPSA